MPAMTIQRIAAALAGVLASTAAPTALCELEERLRFLCTRTPYRFDLLYGLEFLRQQAAVEVLHQEGGEALLRYQLCVGQPILVVDLDVVRGFVADVILREKQGVTVRALRERLTSRWSAEVVDEHLCQVVTELTHHPCVRHDPLTSDIEVWKFTICQSFERCDHS